MINTSVLYSLNDVSEPFVPIVDVNHNEINIANIKPHVRTPKIIPRIYDDAVEQQLHVLQVNVNLEKNNNRIHD